MSISMHYADTGELGELASLGEISVRYIFGR